MPGSAPVARGPPVRRHQNIHVDMNEEREHLKSMIKEEYINEASLDDNSLLMQYFRKQDTDNNNLLDGLELLKTLAKMDCKTWWSVIITMSVLFNSDDHAHGDIEETVNIFDISEMIPYVDTILREDDEVDW